MRVLGIETSCDETSAAVVADRRLVMSSVVSSQAEHLRYGGVVPEIAARAHLRLIRPVVRRALEESGQDLEGIDAVAATCGPGLIGALLVGFGFARALAVARQLPFVGVNHIEGHLLSPLLTDPDFAPPFLALIVSGGHTELILCREWHRYVLLGSTLDDACGEAFDKAAVLLDLGYPGGPLIEAAARSGRPEAHEFPRARLKPGSLDFSFSGLKTAVRLAALSRRAALGLEGEATLPPGDISDLAASFQAAAVDALSARLGEALERHPVPRVVVAGGVAANSVLRERVEGMCGRFGVRPYHPPLRYCGDNAAMIAAVGFLRLSRGERWSLSSSPAARHSLADLA